MSATQHIEWLNLVEKTGPFLAVGVLDEAFPQGLDKVETRQRQRIRSAYDEWRDAVDSGDPKLEAIHREWVRLVLQELLGYDSTVLKTQSTLPGALAFREPFTGVTVRPDFGVLSGETSRLLVICHAPDVDLRAPLAGDAWVASPIERMIQLCRALGVRLGLLTNGECWTVVNVPAEGGSSVATWFARIWQQEPVTLQAFVSILDVRRCFGKAEDTLDSLLQRSQGHQNEITDTLGEQVRRAVEVLVQALDQADVSHNRQLLVGVTPAQLYEAGLTVMMRLVILLCAEQRKLLLLGDETYDQFYSVTTLRSRLAKEQTDLTDEVLERRHDAWSRLLAVCRGVFGGIEHVALRLPPLGGSLFDPDRFPFLEGRVTGTSWRETPAAPLPIDNRTVLTLLTALQVLEQAAGAQLLSYESLDVEQIGHVYEGLLERTVKRVSEITVGLNGSAKAINPNVALAQLEEKAAIGSEELISFLQETTGRSPSALRKALEKPVDDMLAREVASACGTSQNLIQRLSPFAHLIRKDSGKRLLIYQQGSFIVTLGDSRRSTGTHYTPKSLTEPIVLNTLQPSVFIGPSEGKPRDEWRLRTPAELMALKVCDMAMGSAAFLVQSCRWLGDRLVEAWEVAETSGRAISIEGVELDQPGDVELLPRDKAERVLIARRLVASRCLYGVDKNPMAVELAKVSLWLVTMMKGRPFSFLDHALKCGDSLLGISSLKQIELFSLRSGERQITFATANLRSYVEAADEKRRELENLPSNDYRQIESKNRLHTEAEAATSAVKSLADCLIAVELRGLDEEERGQVAEQAHALIQRYLTAENGTSNSISKLASLGRERLEGRRPFHWPLEFPEVFARGGFDAFIGNPPFMGGQLITFSYGKQYREYLVAIIAREAKGSADLCAYFILRATSLLVNGGSAGLIATNTIAEGETRQVGLDQIEHAGARVRSAITTLPWPGEAVLAVSILWIARGAWNGRNELDGEDVNSITSALKPGSGKNDRPLKLVGDRLVAYKGSSIQGVGFLISPKEAASIISADSNYARVLFPYLGGSDVTSSPDSTPRRWAINFFNWTLQEAEQYPICLQIARDRVKPAREKAAGRNKIGLRRAEFWWRYDAQARKLYEAIGGLKSVWVLAETSKYAALAMSPCNVVFAHKVIVICTESFAVFACLSSSIHQAWIRQVGASLKTDIEYSIADILDTFPIPKDVCTNSQSSIHNVRTIHSLGEQFFRGRQNVMQRLEEGLTKFYNRFHSRAEQSTDVARLRALQVEMDQAVVAAYGFTDLNLEHGFHATKHGERYTISEAARRRTLSLLLALNHQQNAEEVAAGLHAKKTSIKRGSRSTSESDEFKLL
jgi:hypothetical protein